MSVSTSGLVSDLDVDVTPAARIGTMTWYGLGGRADLLVVPHSIEALETLMRRCRRSATPMRILGSGANLLVADEGVDGVVVKLSSDFFREMRWNQDGPEHTLRAMAGADMARTLMETTRRGLRGLTAMAGIPASIGGAIRMNAGGRFGAISDALLRVTAMSSAGRVVTYARDQLRFEYRSSNIPDPIILWADFSLTPDDPIRVRDEVKEIFAFKKGTQPLADHSAGCAFRNPVDPATEQRVSAGMLIDRAGLKGHSVGGAEVSQHHANFIVVKAGATARDVLTLLSNIKSRVFDHCGIQLAEEIVIWRRDSNESQEAGESSTDHVMETNDDT